LVTCYDTEYKDTKLIKQGRAALEPLFAELAGWVASTWEVTVLNVVYDQVDAPRRFPRLQVIVEHADEQQKFRAGFNFDPSKQQAVAEKFAELVAQTGSSKHKADRLLVVFSAFAPLAREEADTQISDADIEDLQKRLTDPALWTIHRCFGRVVFMFYTDAQAHARKARLESYSDQYFELLRQHDEFKYLNRRKFSVESDSKENFDNNYNGSWLNYDR
jgi:hypothetical protein